MTSLEFEKPQFQPTSGAVVKTRKATQPEETRRVLRWASLPAKILVPANLLVLVLQALPEFRMLPFGQTVVDQVAVLVGSEIVTKGGQFSAWAGPSTWLATVMLVASVALALTAPRPVVPQGVVVLTALGTAVPASAIAVQRLTGDDLAPVATGLLLLVMVAGTAWATAIRSGALRGNSLPQELAPSGTGVFVLLMLTGVVPLAVGRHLYSDPIISAAGYVATGTNGTQWSATLHSSSFLLWGAGGAAILAVLATLRLLRHRPGQGVAGPVIALVIALGPGLAVLTPMAASAAEDRAAELRNDSPLEELPRCGGWSTSAVPSRTLAIAGQGCTKVVAFSGYRQEAELSTPYSLRSSGLATPEGQSISGGLVSGAYGNVIAVAGTHESGAQGVFAFSITSASHIWGFACAPGETFSVRFAGSADEDPPAGRITKPGEPPSILVGCDSRLTRLRPSDGSRY